MCESLWVFERSHFFDYNISRSRPHCKTALFYRAKTAFYWLLVNLFMYIKGFHTHANTNCRRYVIILFICTVYRSLLLLLYSNPVALSVLVFSWKVGVFMGGPVASEREQNSSFSCHSWGSHPSGGHGMRFTNANYMKN